MQRNISILGFLLFLFFSPTQLFAFECVDLQVQYFLACQDNVCDGFKVRGEDKNSSCQEARPYLPYVFDLQQDEGEQIHHYLHSVAQQIEIDGFWQIEMNLDCASALLNGQGNENVQDRLVANTCSKGITSHNLSNDSLQTWREREENKAKVDRINIYISQGIFIALSVTFGGILPLITVLNYIKTRNYTFIQYVILALVGQAITIFLSLLFIRASWIASFILTPLLLIELTGLIGAKLGNQYRKMHQ